MRPLKYPLTVSRKPPVVVGCGFKYRIVTIHPHTRIEIVRLAWLYQGVYGKMTQIAQSYQISRAFLYQLMFRANLQLEMLFSDAKPLFQKDHRHVEHLSCWPLPCWARRTMRAPSISVICN